MSNENRQNSHFWSKNGHLGSGCYKFHKHANVRLLLQGISYPGQCALIFWNPHKSLLPATGQPKAAIFFQKWKFRTLRRLVDSHLRSQSSFEMRTIHKYKIYILLTILIRNMYSSVQGSSTFHEFCSFFCYPLFHYNTASKPFIC